MCGVYVCIAFTCGFFYTFFCSGRGLRVGGFLIEYELSSLGLDQIGRSVGRAVCIEELHCMHGIWDGQNGKDKRKGNLT